MSNFITQQAAQAHIAEEIRAAELRALVREARRADRASKEPRSRRLHVAVGHVAHA